MAERKKRRMMYPRILEHSSTAILTAFTFNQSNKINSKSICILQIQIQTRKHEHEHEQVGQQATGLCNMQLAWARRRRRRFAIAATATLASTAVQCGCGCGCCDLRLHNSLEHTKLFCKVAGRGGGAKTARAMA